MKLAQIPTGNLTNHIVQRRLKECAGSLGNGILQVEKPVAQSEFGGYESERITRCLRGKCRRTAQAGIYLYYTIVFAFRVVGILYIALAHNTDMADDADSQFTQFVIIRIA